MRALSDFESILAPVMRLMAKSTGFRSQPPLRDVFAENEQILWAISHGSPLSWLPAVSLLALEAARHGGGARKPMAVMDRFFFQVPLLRDIAAFFTQSGRPLDFAELASAFKNRQDTDLVLFPEGSNCFFGAPESIQDFRSVKFVELAVRTGCPIMICVHTGSESWAHALEVAPQHISIFKLLPLFMFNFVEERLRRYGRLVVPLLPLPMERFEMHCELYRPTIALADLPVDPGERRQRLATEAGKIRARMISLLSALRGEPVPRVLAPAPA